VVLHQNTRGPLGVNYYPIYCPYIIPSYCPYTIHVYYPYIALYTTLYIIHILNYIYVVHILSLYYPYTTHVLALYIGYILPHMLSMHYPTYCIHVYIHILIIVHIYVLFIVSIFIWWTTFCMFFNLLRSRHPYSG
jgi:hypothetical protein